MFVGLDRQSKGFLDKDTIKEVLKGMKSADDKPLDDNDVELILKTAKDGNHIVLGDFIALLYRVKLFRKSH